MKGEKIKWRIRLSGIKKAVCPFSTNNSVEAIIATKIAFKEQIK